MTGRSRPFWNLRSLVWAAAVLGLSAAFVLLVARPQVLRMRNLANTVQSERAGNSRAYQSLDVIAKAQKETAALVARVADFDQRIPREPMLGDFLEELARLAQKRDLQSDTLQPGEPIRSAEVVALPIAIKVHGSFAASTA